MKNNNSKKPDQVVYDEQSNSYNASLKPYATNVGAPAIAVEDMTAWKNTNVHKVNHHFKAKFEQIKKEYETMMERFEYNNLIYSASFNFEPVIGSTYHLYISNSGEPFISLISPQECSWDFKGSFTLTSDKLWQRVDDE